jgi:dipeptidyl aminopeptidase/acylaminoacyl peptidase
VRAAPAAVAVEVTPALLLELRRPGDLAVSPDGSRVAFTVMPVYREKGGRIETRLWVDEAPATEPGAADAAPVFSPDGSQLAFASDRGHAGRMSVWIHGRGEVGEIPGSVEAISWSPDASRLLVLAADLGSDRAGVQTATKIVESTAEEDDPRVVRPSQHWRRLWSIDVESGAAREVTPRGVNVFEFDWRGGNVAAVCTAEPSESAWYDAYVGLLDLDAGTVERVHEPEWQLQAPRISRAGRVAWIEGFASDRDVVTGTIHVQGIGPLAPELDVTWIEWDGDDALWYAGSRRSASHFGRLRLDGSYDERAAVDAVLGVRYQQRVSVGGERVVATYESPDDPPEIVDLTDGMPQALTALNDDLRHVSRVAEWRDYTWESFDGTEIQGLLFLPRDRPETALPLVVYVHGGPTSTWSAQFPISHWLLLAQAGYAVLLPNPRGSSGRGQEFSRANLGDMGGDDLKDILTGVDALVRDGIADDERVAITGGSYGGFMSSWAVTQTDRFAAAIPFAVVTDWTSFHYTTNIGQFDMLFLQGKPDDPSGPYPKWSPVFHARDVKTPTLIIHGADDLCTPLPQATEFYNALVEAGCEVELVIYPREGHGWTEREHQIDAWQRIEGWLSKHLAP